MQVEILKFKEIYLWVNIREFIRNFNFQNKKFA